MQSFSLTMQDILPLLPLDTVVKGRSVDLPCPACNDTKKHLNINLEKNVFRCNRCGEHGGILSLYCLYYPQSMKSAFHEIQKQLQGETVRRKMAVPGKKVVKKYVPQSLLADISVRNKTYRALLALLNLSGDHEKKSTGHDCSGDTSYRCAWDEWLFVLAYPAVRRSAVCTSDK